MDPKKFIISVKTIAMMTRFNEPLQVLLPAVGIGIVQRDPENWVDVVLKLPKGTKKDKVINVACERLLADVQKAEGK